MSVGAVAYMLKLLGEVIYFEAVKYCCNVRSQKPESVLCLLELLESVLCLLELFTECFDDCCGLFKIAVVHVNVVVSMS